MTKYYDIDDTLTEEEVNNFFFFSSLVKNRKMMTLSLWFLLLQFIPFLFNKPANGVNIDPSAENTSVSVLSHFFLMNIFFWLKFGALMDNFALCHLSFFNVFFFVPVG